MQRSRDKLRNRADGKARVRIEREQVFHPADKPRAAVKRCRAAGGNTFGKLAHRAALTLKPAVTPLATVQTAFAQEKAEPFAVERIQTVDHRARLFRGAPVACGILRF